MEFMKIHGEIGFTGRHGGTETAGLGAAEGGTQHSSPWNPMAPHVEKAL